MILFSPQTIYPAVRILARMQLLIMSVNVRILGLENVDQKHPYIVMGNHESLFDIFVLPVALPICLVRVGSVSLFSTIMVRHDFDKWNKKVSPILMVDLGLERPLTYLPIFVIENIIGCMVHNGST